MVPREITSSSSFELQGLTITFFSNIEDINGFVLTFIDIDN